MAGVPTSMGSLVHQGEIADADSPLVARIRAAGAVIVGKTTTSEYGWKGESGNRVNGPAHNPWRHGLTAGGSSGGSAAAVAAGVVADGAGRRRRRLDPDPRLVLRRVRAEADGGPGADGARLGPLGPGPDRPHGGRRGAPARRHGGDVASRARSRRASRACARHGRPTSATPRSRPACSRSPRPPPGGCPSWVSCSRTPTPGSTTRGPSSTRSGPGTRPRARIPTSATSPTRAAGRWSSAAFG